MRKLGHGQSVVFCVPPEIRTKIREMLPDAERQREIQPRDILRWSIQGTWAKSRREVQLWASQGRRHEKSQRLWTEFTRGNGTPTPSQAKQLLEPEAQTILERYRPGPREQEEEGDAVQDFGPSDPITAKLRDFDALECDAAALHEEQERELAPEIETEREQERPPSENPERHILHDDIKRFAAEGIIIPGSVAYRPAFSSLSRTRAGEEFDIANISPTIAPNLLVTTDFSQTVKLPNGVGVFQDSYLRPVQWVAVSPKKAGEDPFILIVSPYEANELMRDMSPKSPTTLHVYCPRINPAYPSLDDLRLFSFPRKQDGTISKQLLGALNLFSGQLYFNDYEMYVSTCRFLGLSWENAKNGEELDSNGFILQDSDGRVGGESGLPKSPVKFLRDLMIMRQDSQAIGGTHVGDMLDNPRLTEGTFK